MPAAESVQGFPCSRDPGLPPSWTTLRPSKVDVVTSDDERATMTTGATATDSTIGSNTPTERLLTAALLAAPLIYLAADSTYAARGWDDATAGVIHILGAIAYGFVVLRVVSWLPPHSKLAAAILVSGLIGFAGNVAYGFETIHLSLGDVALVRQPGMANIIKPLGLFFPFSFALIALALTKLGHRWQAALVLAAMVAWPIAHIGNIAAVAVPVNILLVVAFGSLVWSPRALHGRTGPNRPRGSDDERPPSAR